MTRRNWKHIQPSGLRDALLLCKEHARDRKNLSVERIAELMGITDHWTVYKWIQNGRIPATMIQPYESVCGINLITRWLARSSDHLLISIPTGRKSNATDIQSLQVLLNAAVGQILKFHANEVPADDVLGAIQNGMEGLSWHRENIKKHHQPELGFSD